MPVANGEIVYRQSCSSCHTTNGDPGTGPTFKGLYGKSGQGADGSPYTANDDYIKESILYPNRVKVKGFEKQAMPAQKLKENEIQSIILFLKTLK